MGFFKPVNLPVKKKSTGFFFETPQVNFTRMSWYWIFSPVLESPGFKKSVFISPFLAHLSRKLEWAIVIAHRPSSVRPTIVRPSVWRKLFTFSTSSPAPFNGFWWNLVGMKYSWSLTSVVQLFFRQIRPGEDPGRGKNRSQGSTSSTIFFFRLEGYSNKPNA